MVECCLERVRPVLSSAPKKENEKKRERKKEREKYRRRKREETNFVET